MSRICSAMYVVVECLDVGVEYDVVAMSIIDDMSKCVSRAKSVDVAEHDISPGSKRTPEDLSTFSMT